MVLMLHLGHISCYMFSSVGRSYSDDLDLTIHVLDLLGLPDLPMLLVLLYNSGYVHATFHNSISVIVAATPKVFSNIGLYDN